MITTILTPLIPVLALLFPGVLIVGDSKKSPWHFLALASIWSVTINSLTAFLGFLLHVPASGILIILALINIILLPQFYRRLKNSPINIFYLINGIAILFLTYLILAIPFIYFHDALPTGDSQKAIFWGQQILDTNSLPDYSIATSHLNRDPQDFFTPALHSFTALIMASTPYPLIAVGFVSLAASILTSMIGAAIAQRLVGKTHFLSIGIFTFLLAITQLRFLRYIREPGYHFQNIFGELLLFGIILLILTFMQDRLKRYLILGLLALTALFLTHQFTTFIVAFTVLPLLIYIAIHYRQHIQDFLIRHKYVTTVFVILFLLAIVLIFQLNLHTKLPHIFTSNPHLLGLAPNLMDYPRLMGLAWITLALAGLILMIAHQWSPTGQSGFFRIPESAWRLGRGAKPRTEATGSRNKQMASGAGKKNFFLPQLVFIIFTAFLLVLSQGPRLNIDIPPVRALFYTAIPLSIFAAYLLSHLVKFTKSLPSSPKLLASLIITVVTIIAITTSTSSAFNISHKVRTNSTFLPAYQNLIDYLNNETNDGTLLTDDYNRRGSSWLLLSHHPMLTRISGDLERQMDEAYQSEARRSLYLQQLDFEKIFSLGSRPESGELLKKYNIKYITGIDKASATALAVSPLLTESRRGGDIIIYEVTDEAPSSLPEDITKWLLKPSTLIGDIGDAEDTFKHLPISLRTTRLSDPVVESNQTYRTTTAPIIPIKVNIGDYIRILTDQDRNNISDVTLELLLLTDQSKLDITTDTGDSYTYDSSSPLMRIKPHHAPIDDQGFITLNIANPAEVPINIDLIAVGLSSIP